MTSLSCPRCGTALAENQAQGLCPRCLLEAAGGPQSQADLPASADAPQGSRRPSAPTIEQLAVFFPSLQLESLIAVGGMGAVYRATQTSLGRTVALKILHGEIASEPGFAERFQREARTLATLSHPGIVTVHDFGSTGPHFYFVMEFVDGVNLRQMIRAKSVPSAAALELVMQICDALQYAHDRGVVHRDIKPENILVERSGRVKILDFGLSKVVGAQPKSPLLTRTHQVMGTPHYMAPEQWEKPLEVDHRADIYALGVVFYELLTGELPLGRFAPPSRKVLIDVRLDEVVLRTLDKEPRLRYQQASELRSEVEHISSSAVAEAPPAQPPPIPSIQPAPPLPPEREVPPPTPGQRRAARLLQRARERQAASRESRIGAAVRKTETAVGTLGGPERLPGPMIGLIVYFGMCMALIVVVLLFYSF
ncbi:MAG TPA: serine/threonine-protein kinase [Planctomycetota bacterium]|nr:serine/threonine-protein kinase [Planctomycetota bacterium]